MSHRDEEPEHGADYFEGDELKKSAIFKITCVPALLLIFVFGLALLVGSLSSCVME